METKKENCGEKNQTQLLEENRLAKTALQNKSQLIDNMAYQIRTLSNAIIGFSDLLMAENLNEELKEYVGEIHQAGKAMSVLVNDVLDMSKLSSGNLNLTKVNCNLAEYLNELYQITGIAAQKKGLSFSIVADSEVPAYIFTDGARMAKCIAHLTTDAIKYTKQGYIRISISMVQNNNEPWFRFDIEDSGEGIAPERIANIFEEVAQIENSNRGVLSRMDMGLTITGSLPVTKRLVSAMGGDILVSSKLGTGTTFSLLLPAGLDVKTLPRLDLSKIQRNYEKDSKTKLPSKTASKTTEENESGHILLVEDQASNRMVVKLLLESMGLKVTSAEDGQIAVQKATNEHFDLILMDLMLPNMNGFEATRILREKKIRIPIIALSASVVDENESKCIARDFDTMLFKPVDGKQLQQVMQTYLAGFHVKTKSAKSAADNSDNVITIEYKN